VGEKKERETRQFKKKKTIMKERGESKSGATK
jgi:hypothetical protein